MGSLSRALMYSDSNIANCDAIVNLRIKMQTILVESNPRLKPAKSRFELMDLIEQCTVKVVQDMSKGILPYLRVPTLTGCDNCCVGYKRIQNIALEVDLLAKIYKLLMTDTYATRRELYYGNKEQWKNQGQIDRLMVNLSRLFDVPQWQLHILTTSRGLVSGPITFKFPNHSIDCSQTPKGVGIPQNLEGVIIETTAKYCLVVEKDAVYQRIIDEGFPERHGPVIIITGKGVPDVNTRQLVSLLGKIPIPLFGIFDPNPYGVEILVTFKFGSRAQEHLKDRLSAEGLTWLGVHPTDLKRLGAPTQRLTHTDLVKLTSLIHRPILARHPDILKQLKQMKNSGLKGEIEGVANLSAAYLTDVYIPSKIERNQFI